MSIKSKLIGFLSNLPNVETSSKRQALITFIGFDHLKNQIDWEGHSLEFFNGLIETLARQGKSELQKFVDELAKTPWVSDIEQKEKLAELQVEIEEATPDDWFVELAIDGISFEELIFRCKKATAQEIKIVGSKYISELYFPRYRLDAKFERFVASDTTCFLVVAKAGRGKTNFMCRIVEERQDERPILFVSGRKEPKDDYDFLKHISNRLGYAENWQACFKDLGSLADSSSETLILIDGINESSAKPSMMQAGLRELLVQAASHRIKVCVSCRTDFWRFYRAPFWGEYIHKEEGPSKAGKVIRGEDLQSFQEENFSEILEKYFAYFGVKGELIDEARERCHHPLMLRFFCEAYKDTIVQTVSQIRLYPLFKLFWHRKIEQIQDLSGLPQPYPVNQLVLTIARLMRQRHQTKVPRNQITEIIGEDETQSDSLYFRVLDEEIILEEELDELAGTTSVIFVYDKFSEYAIALSIFSDLAWYEKESYQIQAEAIDLMREEAAHEFATLRGALEFAVLRVEDQRLDTGIHYDIIKAMLDLDWKWRRIGSLLAFQLTQMEADSFWQFIDETFIHHERDFVRRICAEQIGRLTVYDDRRALPLLNQCLIDENKSVRQVAKETLLNLDPQAAIREAELLVTEKPFDAASIPLAAETLLFPADSLSLLLQSKARWLVKENRNDDIQAAIYDFFVKFDATPYEDLYVMEEYERAFQVDWTRNHRPGNPYLEMIAQQLEPKRRAFEVDTQRLETLRAIRTKLLDFAVSVSEVRPTELDAIGKADLNLLFADTAARNDFLRQIEMNFQRSLPKWLYKRLEENTEAQQSRLDQVVVDMRPGSITLEVLAIEIARSSPIFADQHPAAYLVKLPLPSEREYFWYSYDSELSQLMRLCRIADIVLKEAAMLSQRDPSSITLDTELADNGLKLKPEERTRFRNKAASLMGAELDVVRHRALFNLGRVSFWLWQAEATVQHREDALQKKIEEVRDLGSDALKQRQSVYESMTLSEEAQQDLVLEIQALYRCYAESEPVPVLEILTPLIVWHYENDSSVLSQAFQSLYWREQDNFWQVVVPSLLEHEDQRVIDFASQVAEQAEYAEESVESSNLNDRVKAVIAEKLSLDAEDVVPDAGFVDDLGADSLDLVELIMSLEEEFDIEISDADAEKMSTVADVLQFLNTQI